MPPRCEPETPDFAAESERVVWQALRNQLPDDAALITNLNITDTRGDYEADLVVLWPGAGIVVIEVKGGQVSRNANGEWVQSSRGSSGVIYPVERVRKTKFAIRNYIRKHTSMNTIEVEHMVAFPYTPFTPDFAAPDCPREMVLDKHDIAERPAELIRAMLTGKAGRPPAVGAEEVARIVDLLTGRPPGQVEALVPVDEAEADVDLLTQKQAMVLELLRGNRRLEIRGGAGTGKTFLAIEQARRLARSRERVAFVCYSHGLATFLQRRFATLPAKEQPAYVGTFHNLGVTWGANPVEGAPAEYWEHELPEEMLRLAPHLSNGDRFDAVIVDEAQDFSDSWWPALLAGLRDPDSTGVYVFSDEGQRIFSRHGRPPIQLPVLALDENLRNTKQIAQTFGSLAAVQMRNRGLDGPPVQFVPCTTDDALSAADDQLDRLMAEGWPPESVALLTTYRRHPVQVERQNHGTQSYWNTFWENDDAFFGHVLGFKGLERPAVVLAINGFRVPERAKEMLYVGMSRARDLLVVCGDPELIRQHAGDGVMNRLRN